MLNAQLPDGAALDRTDKVVREMSKIAREEPRRCAHDRPARLLGRAGHEHQQRRRHVRDPRAVRGASRQAGARRPGDHGAAAREVQHDHRGACRRVRRAAGRRPGNHRRLQAASAGSPQRRPAFACRVRSKTSPTRATAIRGWPACSRSFSVTQPQLYVDVDEEKAKAQANQAARISTPRCRPISARSMSTTSSFRTAIGRSTCRRRRAIG